MLSCCCCAMTCPGLRIRSTCFGCKILRWCVFILVNAGHGKFGPMSTRAAMPAGWRGQDTALSLLSSGMPFSPGLTGGDDVSAFAALAFTFILLQPSTFLLQAHALASEPNEWPAVWKSAWAPLALYFAPQKNNQHILWAPA